MWGGGPYGRYCAGGGLGVGGGVGAAAHAVLVRVEGAGLDGLGDEPAALGFLLRHAGQGFGGGGDVLVVVVDQICGVLTVHLAGRCLDLAPSGIQLLGR